jgi:hypothetical protein
MRNSTEAPIMTTFINPTSEEIAVRDELASISRLETNDATRVIVGRINEVKHLLAKEMTAEQIAIHLHLAAIIGLHEIEEKAVLNYLASNTDNLRLAVEFFGWLDYEYLHAEGKIDAFVVKTTTADGYPSYYTGRAGDGWVDNDRREAFRYASRAEAERKITNFNSLSSITGLTFEIA